MECMPFTAAVYFNMSLETDIYLGCFQFGAFIRKAAVNTGGTGPPGNASSRNFLGLAFLSAKEEGWTQQPVVFLI